MKNKEMSFDKWFHIFCKERNIGRVFVTDKDFAPLICGIAQIEAFENRFINSAFSAFATCRDALERAGLNDPLTLELWTNEDYSKAIILFFETNGELDKIKIYPDLKSSSFYCYQQTKYNEEERIKFVEEYIDYNKTSKNA